VGRRDLDLGVVAALTWILVAIGLTVLLGPRLGLRGWTWLGVHHVLCVVGSGHELWRAVLGPRRAALSRSR